MKGVATKDDELPPWTTGDDPLVVIVDAEEPTNEVSTETPKKPADRTFRIVSGKVWPEEAISWTTPKERREHLLRFRRAWLAEYGAKPAALRFLIVFQELIGPDGYAFAGDRFYCSECAVSPENLARMLAQMDRAGAIFRVQVPLGRGTFERRIYPARALVERHYPPVDATGTPPCCAERNHPVRSTGQNITKGRSPLRRTNSVADAARLEADRRDARERGHKLPGWLDD